MLHLQMHYFYAALLDGSAASCLAQRRESSSLAPVAGSAERPKERRHKKGEPSAGKKQRGKAKRQDSDTDLVAKVPVHKV